MSRLRYASFCILCGISIILVHFESRDLILHSDLILVRDPILNKDLILYRGPILFNDPDPTSKVPTKRVVTHGSLFWGVVSALVRACAPAREG